MAVLSGQIIGIGNLTVSFPDGGSMANTWCRWCGGKVEVPKYQEMGCIHCNVLELLAISDDDEIHNVIEQIDLDKLPVTLPEHSYEAIASAASPQQSAASEDGGSGVSPDEKSPLKEWLTPGFHRGKVTFQGTLDITSLTTITDA